MTIIMFCLLACTIFFFVDCILFRIQNDNKRVLLSKPMLVILGAASFLFMLCAMVCSIANDTLKHERDKLKNDIENSEYELYREPLYRKKCIKK